MVFTFQPPFFAGLSGYVAELGAAFLAADLGLGIEPRPDHSGEGTPTPADTGLNAAAERRRQVSGTHPRQGMKP